MKVSKDAERRPKSLIRVVFFTAVMTLGVWISVKFKYGLITTIVFLAAVLTLGGWWAVNSYDPVGKGRLQIEERVNAIGYCSQFYVRGTNAHYECIDLYYEREGIKPFP